MVQAVVFNFVVTEPLAVELIMNFNRKMDEETRQEMQTISVLVEGRNCYQKVTKTTTCGNVIQHLLKFSGLRKSNKDFYFLIASNNIIEQQLSNKMKILKVAEDLMSGTNRIHFILRKKTRRFVPKVPIVKRRLLREKSSAKELKFVKVEHVSIDTSKYAPVRAHNEQIRAVKRLCELVQVQKRRLSEVYQKHYGTAKFTKQSMEKEASFLRNSKADNSLDQFLNNVNEENLQEFLAFCDMVATKEMENISSTFPITSSVDQSIIDGDLSLMQCKFDRKFGDHASETQDGKLNTTVNEISHSKLNTVEDVTKDIMILEDKQYDGGEGKDGFVTMSLPLSRRLTIADPSRIRRNEKPVHSTPLANKTMTYLNKSINQTRMMRQLGTSRLPLDTLTNHQSREMSRCDSNLSRSDDGDLSMFICQKKPAFSKQNEKFRYFWEHSYVSESDGSLDHTGQDLEDAFVNTSDASMNDSTHTGHTHSKSTFDSSSRVLSHVQHVQEEAKDSLSIPNLKMKLVNYSLSDCDISSMSCESVGMSCDFKTTPCATFTGDYVTRLGNSSQSVSDTGLSSFGSDDQIEKSF